MKRILPVFLLLLLLLTGCGETTSNASSEDGYQQISQEEAKEMMDTQDVIILDVREQDEYDSGHIPGAVLLPVGRHPGYGDRVDNLQHGSERPGDSFCRSCLPC